MKNNKLIKASLATALAFTSVGAVVGCNKEDTTKTEKSEQEKIYDLYVSNVSAKGETPLTYEQWLASIKGEKGEKGDDGHTPVITIGQNGNWYVDGVDTTVKAQGEKGNPGDDGHTPIITIGQNGNWFIDGIDSGKPSTGENGKDASYMTYTITYSYQVVGAGEIFENYSVNSTVKSIEWLTEMPVPKDEYKDDFDGWYVEGTNVKIENYDFIGGNVTLVDRWKKYPIAPAGLYQENQLVMSWEKLVETYPEAFVEEGVIKASPTINGAIQPSYLVELSGDLVVDKSITTFGSHSFYQCRLLESIVIATDSDDLKFDSDVIYGCSKLTRIIVNDDNPNYSSEDGVIYNKSKTELIRCPEAKETINIPSTVTTIKHGAFESCYKLKTIKLSANVTNIGDGYGQYFYGCSNLESIVVDDNNPNYSSEDGVLFNKNKTELLKYPHSKEGLLYEIPSTVTTIRSFSFYTLIYLRTLKIPSMVSVISTTAFSSIPTLIIDSEYISNSIYSDFIGYASKNVNTIYIKVGNDVSNSTYLIENFTKQETSDKAGYDMYVRK